MLYFTQEIIEKPFRKEEKEKLYKYIYGILNNKDCHCYQIGGTEDHIHLAFSLFPSVALSDLIHDIKLMSTRYIKKEYYLLILMEWQSGYAAITHNEDSLNTLIEYIKNQESHHLKEDSKIEYIRHLQDAKIDFNEKYLF